jgi:hypothetical protein
VASKSWCVERNCKHFRGWKSAQGGDDWNSPNVNREGEVPFCTAFPNGIPVDITTGIELHLTPVVGDNGIQYERAT